MIAAGLADAAVDQSVPLPRNRRFLCGPVFTVNGNRKLTSWGSLFVWCGGGDAAEVAVFESVAVAFEGLYDLRASPVRGGGHVR